ncbi:MAG: hypothetical protein J5492_01100, partial [Oxalobacter sp.]|nr:hypothetical protein [Oxalobacter sp.]
KFDGYGSLDAYLDHDMYYQELVEQRDNPTYAWTKEQMLYAVRNSIVNKATGSTDQELKNANVSGRDIILKGMGVGIDKNVKETISAEMLMPGYVDPETGKTYVDYLKQLANADAADVDVTYAVDADGNRKMSRVPVYQTGTDGRIIRDEDSQPAIAYYRDGNPEIDSFVIGGKSPLGIYSTGKVTVRSATDAKHEGDVYLAVRKKDNTANYPELKIHQVTVDLVDDTAQRGDVRILGKAGVTNALEGDGIPNVAANNLIVEGGTGSIGTSDLDFLVYLSGHLTARADKDVYIRNLNGNAVLELASVFSRNGLVSLTSDPGIVMTDAYADIGYINAGDGVSLVVDPDTGVIGDEDRPLRLLNRGKVLELAAGSANIHGVVNSEQGAVDTMFLGTVTTQGNFTATSEGGLELQGPLTAQAEGKPVEVKLSALNDVVLKGTVTAGNTNSSGYTEDGSILTLISQFGTVSQADDAPFTAGALETMSGKGVTLQNPGNRLSGYQVREGIRTPITAYTASAFVPSGVTQSPDIAGDVLLKAASPDLGIAFYSPVAGNVDIENVGEGSLTLRGEGLTVKQGSNTAEDNGHVKLQAVGEVTVASEAP